MPNLSRNALVARLSGTTKGEKATVAGNLRLLAPLEPANGGTVRLNEYWDIVAIDSQAIELLNCPLPDLEGRDFWDAVPETITELYQRPTLKALTTQHRYAFVAHDRFEDRWIQYTFRREAADLVISIRDVGSSQRLEQLLEDSDRYNQLLFEVNPNAMWIFDATSLDILAVNQAATEFYGYPRSDFLTRSLGELFPDGADAGLLSSLDAAAGVGKGAPEPLLCKQQKRDGQPVLVELACAHVNWEGHRAVLVSIVDVADRHLAERALRRVNASMEQELAKSQRDLKSVNRDLSAFTYALSNDLQAPLHAVNGFAAILSDKYASVLDESGRHFVNRIRASTRQMAKLVDDLRTLAQLPQLAGAPAAVDLAPVCRLLIEDLRRHDPGRKVTVEMEASLPLWGDRNLLVIALTCLLDNAWKFTSKKSEGWIKVGLQPGAEPGELVLRVSDNGSGFDKAYSDKLFTAFQRLHSSAEFPGHGLGLAIVKRVAAHHSGRQWAQTGATGASFFMAIPQPASVQVLSPNT